MSLNKKISQETIGTKIKKLRARQKITQDQLSKLADVPYTSLTKIESNVIKKPSIQTIVKIAKGLNITIDELVK
jgi:transcriptional regulator with XRE-family HTH domain